VPKPFLDSLRRDFSRLFSRTRLLPAAAGAGCALIAHLWDRRLAERPRADRNVAKVLRPAAVVGAFKVQSSVALATYGLARATGHRRTAVAAGQILRAQLVSQSTTEALKRMTRRRRPDGGSRLSFPSGHTAASFATATVLNEEFGWRVGVLGYLAAGWVAASRVQVERHYLSDVVAGAAIGIIGARAVIEAK